MEVAEGYEGNDVPARLGTVGQGMSSELQIGL